MSQRSARHTTFVIERTYDASPARVFSAWADSSAKKQWFKGPDSVREIVRTHDFRVGGRESYSGEWSDGKVTAYDACFYDIVPDERLVYGYEMSINKVRISVSLSTVEIKPAGRSTKMIYTEQAVFLDEFEDNGGRETGTKQLLDQLGASLKM